MKLNYIILYVEDVSEALLFYRDAFELDVKFIHESKLYGELKTGETILAFSDKKFVSESLGIEIDLEKRSSFEIAFSVVDVESAYKYALKKGAKPFHPPEQKPWGQTVAYVRDPFGTIVEICSPIE